MRWVSGIYYGDMEAMKAEGQARLEPPRNPGCVSTGYCTRKVYSDFNILFLPLLLLAAGVGFPAACS